MLSFAARQIVHLRAARFQGSSILAADAEKHKFGNISKVKPNSPTVRTAVLADFVPNDAALVLEAPSLHNLNAQWQQCVRNPQIQVARFSSRSGSETVKRSKKLADTLPSADSEKHSSGPKDGHL